MGDFIVKMINLLIKALGTVLGWIVSLLPNSPFKSISNSNVSNYLGCLAWIIPFNQIIAVLEVWCSAIAIYYIAQVIMRWIKAIE